MIERKDKIEENKLIEISDITKVLENHGASKEQIDDVERAFFVADEIHDTQIRQSGEPYIIHPLHVANNLLDMEIYDTNMICAALLHDTLEDAKISFKKGDIIELFNYDIAELVDGVTKISRMNFSTKEEQNFANTRKIITGLTKDVRIILIKLADRLHNMRTLQYKEPKKQKENAIETMEVFVPLALSIGAYKVARELEDLSFQYIKPDEYKRILENREKLERIRKPLIDEVNEKLNYILKQNGIPNEILYRVQNVTTIYRKMQKGYSMDNMYDLFYLKILVDTVNDCYTALRYVHDLYNPINGRFRDYIGGQRTNYYQSLHTTVGMCPSSKNDSYFGKIKIRTKAMNAVAANGVLAYLYLPTQGDVGPKRKTQEEIQNDIITKNPFAIDLKYLGDLFENDEHFFFTIKSELLGEHVYVYNEAGNVIELPLGATALDYICTLKDDTFNKATGVVINGREQPVDTLLNNRDRIEIITKGEKDLNKWATVDLKTVKGKLKVKTLMDRQSA